MPDFEKYIARHGEYGVQAIIENWERHQGIRANAETPLKVRWIAFVGNDYAPAHSQQRIAA